MSGYLWGIAHLVNDPSSEIINALQKRIFSKTSQCVPNNDSKPKTNNSHVCISKSSAIKIKETVEMKTKCVQVGRAPVTSRHIAIQIQQQGNEHISKTTSVQIIAKPKRTTGTLHTATIRDSFTRPIKKRICDNHRDVFTKLQNWSCPEKIPDDADTNPFTYIIKKIKKIVTLLKIEKIQLPEFYETEPTIMKLYRQTSVKDLL